MATDLAKLIAFIEQTGDRCVVLDTDGTPAYVILPLRQYQTLVSENAVAGMSQQDLVEKINTDIAAWRASQAADPADFSPEALAEDAGVQRLPLKTSKKGLTKDKKEPLADTYEFEPIE